MILLFRIILYATSLLVFGCSTSNFLAPKDIYLAPKDKPSANLTIHADFSHVFLPFQWVKIKVHENWGCKPNENGLILGNISTITDKTEPITIEADNEFIFTFIYSADPTKYINGLECKITRSFVPTAKKIYKVQFIPTHETCSITINEIHSGRELPVQTASMVLTTCD